MDETEVAQPVPKLSEERAARLAKARQKALEVRRKNQKAKLEAKLEEVNQTLAPSTAGDDEPEPTGGHPPDSPPPPSPPPPPPTRSPPARKKRTRRPPTLVIEQSSSDSDEFEGNDRVIFVKRRGRAKKAEPPPAPPAPPAPPEPPAEPPAREVTPEQAQIRNYYHTMFAHPFVPSMPRRRF